MRIPEARPHFDGGAYDKGRQNRNDHVHPFDRQALTLAASSSKLSRKNSLEEHHHNRNDNDGYTAHHINIRGIQRRSAEQITHNIRIIAHSQGENSEASATPPDIID